MGHDLEFLRNQASDYIRSYQEYLANKTIVYFMCLSKNQAAHMCKNEVGLSLVSQD